MKVFTTSFFGHRQIDNVFVIEQRLEAIICELLMSKEYVEFLIGRDGEFDQLVASTVRRYEYAIKGILHYFRLGNGLHFLFDRDLVL